MLWYADAPITALGLGGSHHTVMCPYCGRGRRRQVSDLRVELGPHGAGLWLSDGGAVLVEEKVLALVAHLPGAKLRNVSASWRYPSVEPVPTLQQLVPSARVSAAGVRRSGCACRSVEAIPFKPLVLESIASVPDLALLADNCSTVLFGAPVRAALSLCCPAVEWEPAFLAGTYTPPTHSFDGSDWSDLLS